MATVKAENFEDLIARNLARFQIPKYINGYKYLCKAISYNILNILPNIYLAKQIYSMVAKLENSNIACVERSIRYAISMAWQYGPNSTMLNYFGNKKPTNLQFINLISQKIKSGGK